MREAPLLGMKASIIREPTRIKLAAEPQGNCRMISIAVASRYSCLSHHQGEGLSPSPWCDDYRVGISRLAVTLVRQSFLENPHHILTYDGRASKLILQLAGELQHQHISVRDIT